MENPFIIVIVTTTISVYVHVCICAMVCSGHRTASWSQFSPSIFTWALGIKPRSSGLGGEPSSEPAESLASPEAPCKNVCFLLCQIRMPFNFYNFS